MEFNTAISEHKLGNITIDYVSYDMLDAGETFDVTLCNVDGDEIASMSLNYIEFDYLQEVDLKHVEFIYD